VAGRPTKPAECRCSWATAASLPAYRSETTDTHRTLKSVLPPAESLWVNSFLASAPAKNQLRSMQLHLQCSTHLEQSTSRISPATLTSLQALQKVTENVIHHATPYTYIHTTPCQRFVLLSTDWLCIKSCLLLQWLPSEPFAFSALMLLVWRQKGHLACKNGVAGCWSGYLAG